MSIENMSDCPAFREMWSAIPEEVRKYCRFSSSNSPRFATPEGFALTVFNGILFQCPPETLGCWGDTAPEVGYLYNDGTGWKWAWNPEFKARNQ